MVSDEQAKTKKRATKSEEKKKETVSMTEVFCGEREDAGRQKEQQKGAALAKPYVASQERYLHTYLGASPFQLFGLPCFTSESPSSSILLMRLSFNGHVGSLLPGPLGIISTALVTLDLTPLI